MLSIIIPFYNEKDNLPLLIGGLTRELKNIKDDWEVIFVDDGSDDDYSLAANDKIKLIKHRKRLGKGKALATGFKKAKGETIIFMDADLQNDPADLHQFARRIDSGFDLVNGWRKVRNDGLSKTLPSSIFNTFLLKVFLKSKFHDINCGFKAMKKEVLDEIPLYGDNYRFLPVLAEKSGFKTGEVVVKHHPRKHGRSKYGFLRLFFGLLDTLTTYFIYKFSEKPLHFFGPIGGGFFLAGF
jgi:glycosyltransferase involved in cell wall biosynthesis